MRRLLLLSIVLLSIFLAACVRTPPPAAPPDQPVAAPPVVEQNVSPPPALAPVPAPCENSTNVLLRDQCFSQMAREGNGLFWCDRVYSTAVRDACLLPFSATDARLCDQLNNASLRQDCFDSAARRLNDTNLCVRLPDAARKQDCLKALSPPCSFEPTDEATTRCMALAKSDYSYCKSNLCRFQYAKARHVLAACDLISGERALQFACRAVVKNDSSECLAENNIIADYCYQIVAYATDNEQLCGFGTEGSSYRNNCHAHFAIARRDPAQCLGAKPESERDECYLNYSVTLDAPATCESVVNTLNRDRCRIVTARNNGDPSACNAMIYSGRKNCYNIVLTGALPVQGTAACERVDDDLWRDKCYLTLAQQAGNRTICDFIADSSAAAACRSKTG